VTNRPPKPISLKDLAKLLDLSPGTVSRIINGHGNSFRIAEATQHRVRQAAAMHGYTANVVAQSLRLQRTDTIGIMVPEISEGYSTSVLSGIEDELLKNGFFYFVVSHRHRPELLEAYPRMLLARSVEGIIAVDTPIQGDLPVPLVVVSGHGDPKGGVRIELDHHKAAHLALSHLKTFGHRHIAFIKGQSFSSDTRQRWQAILRAAQDLDLPIDSKLVAQLQSPEPGSGPGIEVARALIKGGRLFTAIFAFNDVTAIGVIQALREAGLRVPKDISVLGFDDILAASTYHPPLTTIRQPLRSMGHCAAATLLRLIRDKVEQEEQPVITVRPELIVRKSTGHVFVARSGNANYRRPYV
jgi:DNA-binding LacI/PurR family transcriptional regulator